MKVIYTRENFLHINSEYPQKHFSLFVDEVQHEIKLNTAGDYINIPIYKYNYVSFEKQYAKYIAVSNQRRTLPEREEYYASLGIKKYKEITFGEFTNGNPDNLLILFTENPDYIDQYIDIAINNLKYNTKLIVLFDDYMQYGSNYIFKNNGEYLFEAMCSFITEKTQLFDTDKVTLIGSRTGAKAARLYGSFFSDFKVISFNTEYENMKTKEEIHAIKVNGINLRDAIEFTSRVDTKLDYNQSQEKWIVANNNLYSFSEVMKFSFYFAQINNNSKSLQAIDNFLPIVVNDSILAPAIINEKPLFTVFVKDYVWYKLDTYSNACQNYIVMSNILRDSGVIYIYTENNIYEIISEGIYD